MADRAAKISQMFESGSTFFITFQVPGTITLARFHVATRMFFFFASLAP